MSGKTSRRKSFKDVSPRHMDFKMPFISNRSLIDGYYAERAAELEAKKQPKPVPEKVLKREDKKHLIASYIRAGKQKSWIMIEVACGMALIEETQGDMMLGKYGGY